MIVLRLSLGDLMTLRLGGAGFAAQLLEDAHAQESATEDGREAYSPPAPMFQVTPAEEDGRHSLLQEQSGRLTANNAQAPVENVSNRPPTTFPGAPLPGALVKPAKISVAPAPEVARQAPSSMAAQLLGDVQADAPGKPSQHGDLSQDSDDRAANRRPSTSLAAQLLGEDPARVEELDRRGSNMSLSADNGDGRPGTKRSDRQARTPRFNNKIAPEGLTRGQVENVKQLQAQHLTQGLVFDDSASWRPGTTHVLITSADNDGFSSGTGGKDLLQAAFARTSTAANSALRPGTALPGSVMGSIASHLLLGGDGLLRPGSQRPGASRVGKRPATFRPGSRAVTQSRMSSRLLPNPEDALTKDAVEEIKELHTQQLMHGIDMDPLAWPGLRFGRNPFCKRDLLFHPFSGTMAYTAALHTISILLEFVDVVLRGYGQVTFINNPLAGALIMIASFINNAYYGVFGLLGIVSSTLTAYLFDFPRGAITSGIYGYNGYLVGTAVVLFQADYGGDWNFLEACCGCAADTCG